MSLFVMPPVILGTCPVQLSQHIIGTSCRLLQTCTVKCLKLIKAHKSFHYCFVYNDCTGCHGYFLRKQKIKLPLLERFELFLTRKSLMLNIQQMFFLMVRNKKRQLGIKRHHPYNTSNNVSFTLHLHLVSTVALRGQHIQLVWSCLVW